MNVTRKEQQLLQCGQGQVKHYEAHKHALGCQSCQVHMGFAMVDYDGLFFRFLAMYEKYILPISEVNVFI